MSAIANFLHLARSTSVAVGLTAATLVAANVVYTPSAAAQDAADELRRRLVKLERDMSALRREMRATRGSVNTTRSGGNGKMPPTVAARFELRMTQLEQSIGKLTGRIEDLDYRIKALAQTQKKFQNDIEFRLSELEKGGGTGGTSSAPPRTRDKATRNDASGGNKKVASRTPTPPTAPSVTLPAGKPADQYRFARGFLIERNYAKAEAALQAFVKRHPNNRLTSNAYYWLGETYYAQSNYKQAAVAFADGFKRFKGHSKAPDNLYKLGMSLSKLKMRSQACAAFKELRLRYPTAAPDLRRRADRQRQSLGCPA